MRNLLPLKVYGILLLPVFFSGAAAQEGAASAKPPQVAIFLDTSGSMAGPRAAAMREAAKLAVAILDSDQEVTIIPFNHEAHAANFSLRSIEERRAAMAYIERLPIKGGTDYLVALQVAKLPAGAPAIFLSDGEHNGDAAPVLEFLRHNRPGPLYTVAIETPPLAEKLLKEMAALTGGNHVSVANSERLVTVFVELAKHLGNYRAFSPQEAAVSCRGVTHQLIAFGLDAGVAMAGAEPTQTASYAFSLPGEHVAMIVAQLGAQPCDLTITAQHKRKATGRLAAILRNDLARASMSLSIRDGKAPAGGDIEVKTRFFDAQDRDIDPRKVSGLTAVAKVIRDGKVLAQAASATNAHDPFLRATLRLPREPGPVTIENETVDASKGPPFRATQKQTIFLEEPLILTVTPARLDLETKEGPFTVVLAPHLGKKTAASFAAELQGAPQLRLLGTRTKDQALLLDLQADQAGEYRGSFLIHGNSSLPILSVKVPFVIQVTENLTGLALPVKRSLHLGTFLANSGKTALPPLEIPSLDADAVSYLVELGDFSDGTQVVLVGADQVKVQPAKGKPGQIRLTAQIGNVPAGVYHAKLTLVPEKGRRSRQWLTSLQLTLTEPLAVPAVDFARVEVGKVVPQTLTLRNSSSAVLADLKILKAIFPGQEKELALILPKEIPPLPAGGTKALEVKVAVSPQASARGVATGVLLLQRGTGAQIQVPLRIDIVAAGQGACALVAAPSAVALKGKPGQIVRFAVSIRLSPAAGIDAAKLSGTFQGFEDKAGQTVRIEVGLQEQKHQKVAGQTPLVLQGFLLTPETPGRYLGRLTLASDHAGTVVLPVTLDVQE